MMAVPRGKKRTEDSRDVQDLRDQMYQVKKELLAFKTERELLRSKIHHLEKEVRARDKELEAIAGTGSATERGAAAAMSSIKIEEGRLVTALKQQVRELRDQIQQRDEALAAMETDIAATDIEELQLVAATQFQELQRLRILLEKREDEEGAGTGRDATGLSHVPLAAALQAAREETGIAVACTTQLRDELAVTKDTLARVQREVDGADMDPALVEAYKGVGRAELIAMVRRLESERTMLAEKGEAMAQELAMLAKHGRDLPQLTQRLEAMQAKQAELVAAKEAALAALHEERQQLHAIAEQQRLHGTSASDRLSDLHAKQAALVAERERELKALQAERDQVRDMATRASEQHRAGELLAAEHGRLLAEAEKERAAVAAARDTHAREVEAERVRWLAAQEQRMTEQSTAMLALLQSKARTEAEAAMVVITDKDKKGKPDKKAKAKGVKPLSPAEAEREQAALTFQSHWRRRQAQQQVDKLRASLADNVVRLQAALRGHLARRRMMRALAGDPSAPAPGAFGHLGKAAAGGKGGSAGGKAATAAAAPSSSSGRPAPPQSWDDIAVGSTRARPAPVGGDGGAAAIAPRRPAGEPPRGRAGGRAAALSAGAGTLGGSVNSLGSELGVRSRAAGADSDDD